MKFIVIAAALVSLAACGGSASCRNVVTDYTTSSSAAGSIPTHTACTFDKAALTNTCVTKSTANGAVLSTTVTTWGTLEAAIAQSHPFGRNTHTRQTTVSPSCSTGFTLAYDSGGRVLSSTGAVTSGTCAVGSQTYTAWDGSGRPTQGTSSLSSGSCTGQPFTRAYDDAGRTITFTFAAATGCAASITQSTYDADGFAISTTAGSTTSTTAVAATSQLCD